MHHVARSLVPLSMKHILPRSPRRVVVVGGGPTGLFCADRLRHHFEVSVIDSKSYFEFTPGILRAIGDPSHHSRITFDYNQVLEHNLGVEFVLGEATRVDIAGGAGASPNRGGVVSVATPSGGVDRVSFDYCIVAVGVNNGFWKPRVPSLVTSKAVTTPPKPASDVVVANETTAEARRASLHDLHEKLVSATGAVVVGAGLVGVELAAELTHFFPRLQVTLVDASSKVLPQLAEPASEYARNYLSAHGVRMSLGAPFSAASVADGQVVLWCVGAKTRAGTLFDDSTVLRSNGQIRVNKRMQVLRRTGGLSSAADPEKGGGQIVEEVFGRGRVFAVGDAAAVGGVPMAQMIFQGEDMAAVAVANIEAAEDIASPLAFNKNKREAEDLPILCNTSLGPQDGMFSTQSELLATGALTAMQKQLIESTKMSALQGNLIGSMLWMPVH
eukprot:TRINITY_DN62212_c0_g1_i1.p1 TRINITY_DN62212_c0_g1~~TRINITY_DN62212_c0_g1_i1.p1  ORF type:complete len:469 (-),score=85.04 TRINITY_DN62212_c0_g1_i1:45-1373(-)